MKINKYILFLCLLFGDSISFSVSLHFFNRDSRKIDFIPMFGYVALLDSIAGPLHKPTNQGDKS